MFRNLFIASLVVLASNSMCDAAAFMKLGDIKGEATDAQHREWIEILSFSQSVTAERDAASGLPTGKRQHKPISVTKEIDKSSPLLMQALVMNAGNPTEIVFTRNVGGREVPMYRITLHNARLVKVNQRLDLSNGTQQTVETLELQYDRIVWTWEDGGITAEDDWETPRA